MVYFIRNGGLVGLVLLLFAGFTLCSGVGHLERAGKLARLERDGVTVDAEVFALNEVEDDDKGHNKHAYLVCRFRIGEGAEQVERTAEVFDAPHRSLRPGDRVSVRYSRSDPAVWDVPAGYSAAPARRAAWICFAAGGLAAALVVAMLAAEVYVKRRWPEPPAPVPAGEPSPPVV
jgi:hypothetical protein